jgi:hypothetical protein
MNCKVCGLRVQKDERFVLVGIYPGWWKKSKFARLYDGPEYFGDLYHDACYLKSIGSPDSRQKYGVKP